MRRGWLAAAAVLCGGVALLLAAGCATPTPAAVSALPLDVFLEAGGLARIHDERVPQEELPALLKRLDVHKKTALAVHISDTRDRQTIARLAVLLARAGYHRVAFVGGRRAEAQVR